MVANDLTPEAVLDPAREVAFPESVISLFKGELGYPADGWPAVLQAKVLNGAAALAGRPGDSIPPVDLEQARETAEKAVGHKVDDQDLASYLMYPKVFKDFSEHQRSNGDVSVLPTPVFFYGLKEQQEIAIDLEPGKTLLLRLQGITESKEDGEERLYFELNGQARQTRVAKAGAVRTKPALPKAEEGNPNQVGAPMPGMVVTVAVKAGQKIERGDPLLSIEAMKMETQLRADRAGVVKHVHAHSGQTVSAKDLLVEFQAA
jgi:pyruvate carboxylase